MNVIEGAKRMQRAGRALVIIALSAFALCAIGAAVYAFLPSYLHVSEVFTIVLPLLVTVILFFVLSGFLITSVLLDARCQPHYFRNFYGRRALRIWPAFLLVLAICYLNAPWFVGMPRGQAFRTAPWWAYLLFVQNLFHLT